MRASEIDVRVRTIALIAEIVEIDASKVSGSDRLREDLGMDSLGSLELLSSVSSEMNLDLEAEAAMDIQTVDDACRFVEKHLEAARSTSC